jgi:hypothetical protein
LLLNRRAEENLVVTGQHVWKILKAFESPELFKFNILASQIRELVVNDIEENLRQLNSLATKAFASNRTDMITNYSSLLTFEFISALATELVCFFPEFVSLISLYIWFKS